MERISIIYGRALKLVKGKIAIAMCHFYRYTANINSNKTGTTLVSWKFPQELSTCKQVHYIRLSVEETSCWQKSIVIFLAAVFVFLIIQSVLWPNATVNWVVGSVFHPQKIHILIIILWLFHPYTRTAGHNVTKIEILLPQNEIKASEMLVAPRTSECFGLGLL